MLKNLEKESHFFESLKNKFFSFKNNQKKSYVEDTDNSCLLSDDLESQEFKVCTTQIKSLSDVADFRNKKFKQIYEQTKIVENISNDINSLTKVQSQKLETIDDNIFSVKDNAIASFDIVLKTSKEDKNFKNNKCFILLLISVAMLLMLLIFLNINAKGN